LAAELGKRGGSLRAGADLLGANHGTVDRHIEPLEASYGVQLFQRTKMGLQLTEAGETIVPLAEDAERVFLNARRRVEGLDRTETGTIRFSVSPILALTIIAPILARFFEKYPGIEIEVRLSGLQENIPQAETNVSLHVAYEVSDDVVARKLYALAMCTYASQQYIDTTVPKAGLGGTGLTWIG
jgi:DNA-binding transcriptional LysR family regulator